LFFNLKIYQAGLGLDHANNIKIEEKEKSEFDGYFDSSITPKAHTNYLE